MPKRARRIGPKELSPFAMFTSYNGSAGKKRVNPQYTQWLKEQRKKQQALARAAKQERLEKKKAKARQNKKPEPAEEEKPATDSP